MRHFVNGISNILEKIISDGKQAADALIKDAEKEAAGRISEADRNGAEKKNALIEKAKVDAENIRQRELMAAEMKARQMMLSTKQALIEVCIGKALDKLNSENYADTVTALIGRVSAEYDSDAEIILSKESLVKLGAKFKAGGINNIKLSAETRPIGGGFILKSGDVEVNYSFNALVQMNRDVLEQKIVDILFK